MAWNQNRDIPNIKEDLKEDFDDDGDDFDIFSADEDEEMKRDEQLEESQGEEKPLAIPMPSSYQVDDVNMKQEDENEDDRAICLIQPHRRAARSRRASCPVSPGPRSRSRSPHAARHSQFSTGAIIDFKDAGEQITGLTKNEGSEMEDQGGEDATRFGNGGGDAATRYISENVSLASTSHALYPEVKSERGRAHERLRSSVRRRRSGVRGTRGITRAGRVRKVRRGVSRRTHQWQLGDPIVEMYKRDDEVDPRVLMIALEDERKRQERVIASAARERNAQEACRTREIDEDDSESEDGNEVSDIEEGGATREAFEWFSSEEEFRGQPEVFRVQRTGSVDVHSSPYSAFRALWPDEVLEHIVTETNLYAAKLSRIYRIFAQTWYDSNADEILCLFAFWMMLGIIRMPTIQDCFSTDPLMQTEIFRKLFTKNRYKDLSRALHFKSDPDELNNANPSSVSNVVEDRLDCLDQLSPIINFLNSTFQANYILSRNISIDESLTLWKGRLKFKQYIRSKAARWGIKSFELCESSTGYLWSFRYYTGNLPTLDVLPAGVNKSTGIVMELMRPLLQKGHQLFMDNWYNCPALARWLKRNGTDCVGTLRLNRADVPSLFSRVALHQGQFIARHSGDVYLISWQDKQRITTLSTYHKNDVGLARVYSKKPSWPQPFKPQVVLDYNRSMGGVDLKDQMLEPYLMERKKGKKWYVKLFKRLVNCSILNSRIIYASSQNLPQPHLAFRKQLVQEIMARHLSMIPRVRSHHSKRARASRSTSSNLQPAILNGHWPQSIANRLRCVVCYRLRRKSRQTKYQCSNCKVPLCIECFEVYHTDPNFAF